MRYNNSGNYIPKDILTRAGKYYFKMGFTVFPLNVIIKKQDGKLKKKPFPPKGWKQIPLNDLDYYLQQIEKRRFNGLAILTGKHFVLDIDTNNKRSGMDFIKQIGIHIPKDTPFVTTPFKSGLHFYFLTPPKLTGYSTGSSKQYLFDWRGENGFVFAPPTNLGNGKIYKWGNKINRDLSNLRYPPDKLTEAILRLKQKEGLKPLLNSGNRKSPFKAGQLGVDFTESYGTKKFIDLSPKQKRILKEILIKMAKPKEDRSGYDQYTLNTMVKYGLSKYEIYQLVKGKSKFKGRDDYFELTYNSAVRWIKGKYRTSNWVS